MKEKFLTGTILLFNPTTGYSLGRKIAIPARNIQLIEENWTSINDSNTKDPKILKFIKDKKYTTTTISYFSDDRHNELKFIKFFESFDECISQLQ